MKVRKDGKLRKRHVLELKSRKQLADDLERYRQLVDETMHNLGKIYEMKYNEINAVIALIGVSMIALGGVIVSYCTVADTVRYGGITFVGGLGVFTGICTSFLGYMIAHMGLKGSWL